MADRNYAHSEEFRSDAEIRQTAAFKSITTAQLIQGRMGDKSNGTQTPRDINKKRENILSWEDYFMATAFLAAMRSPDPCSQVGACIVNKDKKIVGVGYNDMPNGCSEERLFPWHKKQKHLYVCHAEMNAIMNRNSADIKKCKMYVVLFPCNGCAKIITQSGISKIIYASDKHEDKKTTKAAKQMFDAAKIKYRQYSPKNSKLVIDFKAIDWNKKTKQPPSLQRFRQRNGKSVKKTKTS